MTTPPYDFDEDIGGTFAMDAPLDRRVKQTTPSEGGAQRPRTRPDNADGPTENT